MITQYCAVESSILNVSRVSSSLLLARVILACRGEASWFQNARLFVICRWVRQNLQKDVMLIKSPIGREVLLIEGVDGLGPLFRLILDGTRLLVDSLIYRGYS